jgi:hypothetical protein
MQKKIYASKAIHRALAIPEQLDNLHMKAVEEGCYRVGFAPTHTPSYWQGPCGYNCLSIF